MSDFRAQSLVHNLLKVADSLEHDAKRIRELADAIRAVPDIRDFQNSALDLNVRDALMSAMNTSSIVAYVSGAIGDAVVLTHPNLDR